MPQVVHICRLCEQKFKREDHLIRHKLSHGKAKFQCSHEGCEMIFHRRDVLHRHEKVHEPNPAIRRRRPRRGAEPKPFVQTKHSSSSPDWGRVSNGCSQGSQTQSPRSTTASVSSKYRGDALADLSHEALDFCYLHFAYSCMQRFPFVHRPTLNKANILPEKLLAMAVLGGFEIPQYRDVSTTFFERAKQLLRQRHAPLVVNDVDQCLDGKFTDNVEVHTDLFQAQVMLIEYALWSTVPDNRRWAMECAFRIANDVVPEVVDYLKHTKPAPGDWHAWIRQEQCIRAVWAYYCVMQKARPISAFSFSNWDILSDLWLPCSDPVFDAPNELSWQTTHDFSLAEDSSLTPYFKLNLYNLMSNSAANSKTLRQITPSGRHILLSALLDQYLNALVLPTNYSTFEAYRDKNLSLLKPRLNFMQTIAKARELWWHDPVALFAACPPRGADLQNNLLISYIEVLMFGGKDEDSVPKQHYLTAVGISCAVFSAMIENGVLEVATQACWITDGASRFYVTEFARVMLRWARNLKILHGSISLDCDDYSLYTQCCATLHVFHKQFSHESATLDNSELEHLDSLLYDAWSIILTNRRWADDLV